MNALATQTQTFIPVCCVCGLAREDGDSSAMSSEFWSEFDAYLTRHGLHGAEYRLTHAYCPVCIRQYVPARRKSTAKDVQTKSSPDITMTVLQTLQTIQQEKQCELDALVRACPHFTWNQIFLEVDRLSRTGDLYLTLSDGCRYVVGMPPDSKIERVV